MSSSYVIYKEVKYDRKGIHIQSSKNAIADKDSLNNKAIAKELQLY